MRRLLGIGIAVTVVLVAITRLGPERSVLSAGPLSPPHAGRACRDCHTPFRSFADDTKCLRCHLALQPMPVGGFAKHRCIVCHGEHDGERSETWARALRACESCHKPSSGTSGIAGLSRAQLRSQVAEFHRDHAPAPPRPAAQDAGTQSDRMACLGCHPMDVAAHVQRAGGSPNQACGECHPRPHAKHKAP